MGNGEWGMGNGEWGMGNGEWSVVSFEGLTTKPLTTNYQPLKNI